MSYEQNKNFYAYTTVFTIDSEEGIEDFWSYFIFRLNLENSENNYERFTRLYNLLNDNKELLSSSKYINISLKESSESFYLSIKTTIKEMIDKFTKKLEELNLSYVYENNVLSYSIDKQTPEAVEPVEKTEVVKYSTYDFITHDDLAEMQACISKMQDGNYNKVYIEEVETYQAVLSCYCGFLKQYPQLRVMSDCVAELCMTLSLYTDECRELGIDFKRLLQSFVNNIWHWQESLFVIGGEELHFMDDSFQADLSQIRMSLCLDSEMIEEEGECLLNDIFDF